MSRLLMATVHPNLGLARALTAVALLALCWFHLARLVAFFGGINAVRSDVPTVREDHAWHYYYTVLGSQYLAATGTTSGYDPNLMAGYPTDVFDSSDRLFKVLFALIPFPSAVTGYKLLVLFSGAVFPLVFFGAARLWGQPRLDALLATAVGIWIWWEDVGVSFFDVGMTGFLLASSFAFLVAGLLAAYLRRPGPVRAAGLALGLALGLLIHVGIIPILATPVLILLYVHRRQLNLRTAATLAAAGAFAAAANLFWALPFAINFRFTGGSNLFFQGPIFFLGIYGAMFKSGHLSYLVVAVAGYLGFRLWRRDGDRVLFLALAATVAVTLFVVLFGSLLPLVSNTEPVRYAMPLLLAPCFAAGGWLASQVRRLRSEAGRTRWQAGLILAVVGVTMALSSLRPARNPSWPPFVGVGRDVALVCDWLKTETDGNSRVLVEEQTIENDVFFETVPYNYITMATNRQIIGGPHWATWMLQHHASFGGKMLLGSNMRLLSGRDLANLLQGYNIGWVVAKSPETVARFDRFPEILTPLKQQDGFHLYRCPRWPAGYFFEGSGQVRADLFRIAVRGARTQRGKVILSYHWHPCLTVAPPRRIFRAVVGDDPVGFIGVEGEGGDYDIQLRYPIFNRRTVK